jgi:hypothetical protein
MGAGPHEHFSCVMVENENRGNWRTLSDEERGKLRLLAAREFGGYASPEIEQAWLEEIKRREREFDEGKVKSIPYEEVMGELRERYCK